MTRKKLLKKYRQKLIKKYEKMAKYEIQGMGGGIFLIERDIKLIESFIKNLKKVKK